MLKIVMIFSISVYQSGKGKGKKDFKIRITFRDEHLDYTAGVKYSQAYDLKE